MTDKYNQLTPGEEERLVMLIEDAGEVIRAASKVLRHGKVATDHVPAYPTRHYNSRDLAHRVGQFIGTADQMAKLGDVSGEIVQHSAERAWAAKQPYTHQQLDSDAGTPNSG